MSREKRAARKKKKKLTKFNRLKEIILQNDEQFNRPACSASQFITYLRWNMHIYNEFERYAIDLRANGRREYYSARAIAQRMRWDTLFQEVGSEYKINNNIITHLARLAMLHKPKLLKGMFKLREQGSELWDRELQD